MAAGQSLAMQDNWPAQQETYRISIYLQSPVVVIYPFPGKPHIAFVWKKQFDLSTPTPTVYFTLSVEVREKNSSKRRYQKEGARVWTCFPRLFADLLKAEDEWDAYYRGIQEFWERLFLDMSPFRRKLRLSLPVHWQWVLWGGKGRPPSREDRGRGRGLSPSPR